MIVDNYYILDIVINFIILFIARYIDKLKICQYR